MLSSMLSSHIQLNEAEMATIVKLDQGEARSLELNSDLMCVARIPGWGHLLMLF